jgi:hypothetical protein
VVVVVAVATSYPTLGVRPLVATAVPASRCCTVVITPCRVRVARPHLQLRRRGGRCDGIATSSAGLGARIPITTAAGVAGANKAGRARRKPFNPSSGMSRSREPPDPRMTTTSCDSRVAPPDAHKASRSRSDGSPCARQRWLTRSRSAVSRSSAVS